jgi:hypothetical protein
MAADASPYAVLELKPGADRAAVEAAYKRLIKLHHPDREGGDPAIAAEINRAYGELRAIRSELQRFEPGGPPRKSRWGWAAMLALVFAGCAIFLAGERGGQLLERLAAPGRQVRSVAHSNPVAVADRMAESLSDAVIEASARKALRLARDSDEVALASASRDCHRRLRARPTLDQFDRCAAFDYAVVKLQDRDPLHDQGPFGELAVTSRQINAASTLSNDPIAVDARLDRISLRVELALASRGG